MADHLAVPPATALAAPAKAGNGWGVAGLILGIVSLLLGAIPFFGFLALATAPFGIISSIVGLMVKNRKRGLAVTGLILSILAVLLGLAMSLGLMIALSGGDTAGFFG